MAAKNAVLILSGGIDSTTLLYDKADEIALAISFDYGSNHNKREIECARWHCEKLQIPHIVIPLEFMGKYFKSSLLEGSDAIPEGHYEDSNMMSTVVPFRNGIMLAIAAGMAESRGLDTVMIANHGGDHAIYPDCREGFISAMSTATAAGTYNNVKVVGPYTNITKGEIVARGKALHVDYSHTYSCYKGGEKHCGKCGTCVERAEAFAFAGLEDPTQYLEDPSANAGSVTFGVGSSQK
jgi:7-cyano-7-deazaguanine synthase